MDRRADKALAWQSKAILLIVVPWTVASVILQARWWATQVPVVAWTTLGISAIFGLIVWRMRAGTLAAAGTGAAITASLMFSTANFPYEDIWLQGGLVPLLSVFLLTYIATKIGKTKKLGLGTAESSRGRNAAQVAANLGLAALIGQPIWFHAPSLLSLYDSRGHWGYIPALAALAEAAADTVSSEIGQIFTSQPRLITTFRRVAPGTDGGVTLAGTAAGIFGSILIAVIGAWSIGGTSFFTGFFLLVGMIACGGVFGLLFDSFLGATLERRLSLNNDAVNFLSTLSAALFALGEMALFVHFLVI